MAGIRFVPDNQITLLQNGETYFPVLEAALDRAEHEIYHDRNGGVCAGQRFRTHVI